MQTVIARRKWGSGERRRLWDVARGWGEAGSAGKWQNMATIPDRRFSRDLPVTTTNCRSVAIFRDLPILPVCGFPVANSILRALAMILLDYDL